MSVNLRNCWGESVFVYEITSEDGDARDLPEMLRAVAGEVEAWDGEFISVTVTTSYNDETGIYLVAHLS